MAKMFLVRGVVYHTPYMGDRRRIDDMRLVMAETAGEAEEKFERWWSDKTVEYSDYYYAVGEALETIE